MPLFESYDRRIKQINEALAKYGIGSIEEAEQLCLSKGINVREIVNGIQPIAFENAGWAYVVGAAKAVPGKTVLSITERGFGKRTPVEEYRITARGGLGIRNYMVTEKTGPIVGIKVVDGAEDLLLVTQAGILIRTAVENIRIAGRATQGVIVMRFKEEGDRVISMALTDREQDAEKEPSHE